jgi:uncharacterized membrane protein
MLNPVQAQNYYEYNVQIRSDGSADWTIIQFSNANATVDTWGEFQQKVFDVVDSASSQTHRAMAVDENTLQINTTVVSDSKTTEYSFTWQNFTITRGNQLWIDDVFQVNNFFGQLYGDAAFRLIYPSDFVVKSVSPAPYSEQNSLIIWSRTQDLTANPVNIVLVSNKQNTSSTNSNWQLYGSITALSAVGVVLFLFGSNLSKRRKNNKAPTILETVSPPASEEEKVLKLLKATGGSMRQSQITEQCRFSKAKTSQLLAVLEKSGSITRYKNGRDKIVTLKERVKGE